MSGVVTVQVRFTEDFNGATEAVSHAIANGHRPRGRSGVLRAIRDYRWAYGAQGADVLSEPAWATAREIVRRVFERAEQ